VKVLCTAVMTGTSGLGFPSPTFYNAAVSSMAPKSVPNGNPALQDIMRSIPWAKPPFTQETLPEGFWTSTSKVLPFTINRIARLRLISLLGQFQIDLLRRQRSQKDSDVPDKLF